MPSFIVHGIPPLGNSRTILALKRALVAAVLGVEHIDLKEHQVIVHFPVEHLTAETGDCITVFISGLFDVPSRSLVVRQQICDAILVVLREWTKTCVAQCRRIEVHPEHPYSTSMGFAKWSRDQKGDE